MAKRFLIYCEICGYRQVANETPKGIEGLVSMKISPVPAGIPKLVDGKVVTKEPIEMMPKYKCPKCGRAVTAKRLPKPLHEPTPEVPKKDQDLDGELDV